MPVPTLAVLGVGLVSGVGLTAEESCAAIRCGINNFQETRFIGGDGEWLVGSAVELEEPWRGITKLAKMAARAIGECFAAASDEKTRAHSGPGVRRRAGATGTVRRSVARAAAGHRTRAWISAASALAGNRAGARGRRSRPVAGAADARGRDATHESSLPAWTVSLPARPWSAYDRDDRLLTAGQLEWLYSGRGRRCGSARGMARGGLDAAAGARAWLCARAGAAGIWQAHASGGAGSSHPVGARRGRGGIE